MPRATLSFNLPEEQEQFNTAVKGSDAHLALWDIAQEIFRPARKHGYNDPKLNVLIQKLDSLAREVIGPTDNSQDLMDIEDATTLVSLLESRFYEIIREYQIELG